MGNGSKRYFFAVACVAAASLDASHGFAYSIPAFDLASSSAYSGGWMTTPPPNGGHGFQAWTFDQGTSADYTKAIIGSDPTIGSGAGNSVWQLDADGTIAGEPAGEVGLNAGRQFDAPMQTNQTFFMNMNVQTEDPSYTSESLVLGSVPTDPSDNTTSVAVFGLFSDAGTGDYDLFGGDGSYALSTIPVNNDPIHFTFTLTSPDTFTATITEIDDPSESQSLSGMVSAPVQFVDLTATATTGADGKVSANFNRMGITPLPPAAIAAAPLLGILALRKFKRT